MDKVEHNLIPKGAEVRRRFRGLRVATTLKSDVLCGEAVRVDLRAGSVLSVTNTDGGATAWVTALLPDARHFEPEVITKDIAAHEPLAADLFDSREMSTLIVNRDGTLDDATSVAIFDADSDAGALFVTKIDRDAIVFIISPVNRDFVAQGGGGRFSVTVQPPALGTSDLILPRPRGREFNHNRVARGTARPMRSKKVNLFK